MGVATPDFSQTWTVRRRRSGRGEIIALTGSLGAAALTAVRDLIEESTSAGRRPVVLDARGVVEVTAAGLAALVELRTGAARRTRLRLRPSPAVEQALRATGLTRLFVVERGFSSPGLLAVRDDHAVRPR